MVIPFRRAKGITVIEIMIVVGILALLAALTLPALLRARNQARTLQCTNNLRQIGQALVMYDMDFDRLDENYPSRLTHLLRLEGGSGAYPEFTDYVGDKNIFICPMDPTRAGINDASVSNATLKPGHPVDNKASWAERGSKSGGKLVPTPDGVGVNQFFSSYLYEFSMRECQRYTQDASGNVDWVGDGWGSQVLVQWFADETSLFDAADKYDAWWDWYNVGWTENVLLIPAHPVFVDRDGDRAISWQEAKFWQLATGDTYTTGYAAPGDPGIPEAWSWDPYYMIFDDEASAQRGYPRNWMPIVRCFWHQQARNVDVETFEEVLNLAVDGNTFYSAPGWEQTAFKSGRSGDYITVWGDDDDVIPDE